MSWRRRILALVIVAQFAVPLWVLLQPDRPARFGWQMYAGSVTPLEITLIGADGTRREVAPADVVGHNRPELAYEDPLPRYLCTHYAGIRGVALRRERPAVSVEQACP
jgi:hypothetical protein